MSRTGRTRLRVLYLAPWAIPGGADKGTVDWFRTLPAGRFETHLITTTPTTYNAFVCAIEPYAAAVWNLPDLMEEPEFGPFILDYISSQRIDIVHIMNSHLGFDLVPAMRARFPRLVIVVQQHAEEPDQRGYVRYVASRYSQLIDAYSATSHDLKDRICGHGADPAKVEVIYTGIDAVDEWRPEPRPDRGEPCEPLRVLFPGRIADQKDPHLMVDVAAACKAAGIDVRIDVVGDGPMRDEVEARVQQAGLADVVVFEGVSYDMASWYNRSDVLLMTSVFEGIPYVIFEAMAMGLPVIVPRVNANHELVDQEVGFLIDPRDDRDAYVAALAQLAGDAAARCRLGEAARARVLQQFPLQRMADEHAALYERLVGRAQARSC